MRFSRRRGAEGCSGCESVAGVLLGLGLNGAVRSAACLRIIALGRRLTADGRVPIYQVDAGDDEDGANDQGSTKRLAQKQCPDEDGDERLDVHPLDACAVGAISVQAAVEDGLQQGAQGEKVASGDQVYGVAHQRDTHGAPVEDQAG